MRTTEMARDLRRTQTTAEAVLWNHLRCRRLLGLKFRRQAPIGNHIADFACPALKLVVEVDGESHHANSYEDSIRDAVLRRQGYLVVRVTNSEVLSPGCAALKTITRAAQERLDSGAVWLRRTRSMRG